MLSAIECVEKYTHDLTKEQLRADGLHLHATVYNVQIVGEAVYKLTAEFKEQHPATPWAVIEKMRHILVHDYFRINYDVLWDVIENDIPQLKQQIIAYLKE